MCHALTISLLGFSEGRVRNTLDFLSLAWDRSPNNNITMTGENDRFFYLPFKRGTKWERQSSSYLEQTKPPQCLVESVLKILDSCY